MTRLNRLAITCLLIGPALFLVSPTAPLSSQDTATLEQGKELLARFLEGDLDAFFSWFTQEMRDGLPPEQLAAFRQSVISAHGREPEELEVQVVPYADGEVFVHQGVWPVSGQTLTVQIAIDTEGRIAGFFIVPASQQSEP